MTTFLTGGRQTGRQGVVHSVQRQRRIRESSFGNVYAQPDVRGDNCALQRLQGQHQTAVDESTVDRLPARRRGAAARRLRSVLALHLHLRHALPRLGDYGRQGGGTQRVRDVVLRRSEEKEIRLQRWSAGVVLDFPFQDRRQGMFAPGVISRGNAWECRSHC